MMFEAGTGVIGILPPDPQPLIEDDESIDEAINKIEENKDKDEQK